METTVRRKPGAFEMAVRTALMEQGMSQGELYSKIHEEAGLYCDNSYLRKIFLNPALAPKIRSAIAKILDIDLSSLEE